MKFDAESVLHTMPLFQSLSPERLSSLCAEGRVRMLDRGETAIRAGETTRALGVVLSGAVRLEREDAMGNRELVGEVRRGEIFAEVFAVLPQTPLSVTAVAAERTAVLFLPVDALTAEPDTALRLLRLVAAKNAALSEKLRHVSRRTTREKLLSFLDAERTRAGSERFTLRFDRQQLADYLAVDRSAMCRALSRLKAEGVLDYDRKQFFFPHF